MSFMYNYIMQITATTPDWVVEQIDELAAELGMSRSALVNLILSIWATKHNAVDGNAADKFAAVFAIQNSEGIE